MEMVRLHTPAICPGPRTNEIPKRNRFSVDPEVVSLISSLRNMILVVQLTSVCVSLIII